MPNDLRSERNRWTVLPPVHLAGRRARFWPRIRPPIIALLMTDPQGHEATGQYIFPVSQNRGHLVLRGQPRGNKTLRVDKTVDAVEKPLAARRHKPFKGGGYVRRCTYIERLGIDAE